MTQLEFIRDKYKNKSFIEITSKTQMKVIDWITGGVKDGQNDVRKMIARISERGFIKFLDEGVILITKENIEDNVRIYPFNFRDDGILQVTIYISDPTLENKLNNLAPLCKVEVGTDTQYKIIEGTYNEPLAARHMGEEFASNRLGISSLLPIIKQVREEFPQLVPDSPEWRQKATELYFTSIIKAQVVSIIGIHAYLALLQKEILITRIVQRKELKKGNSSKPRSNRNPFYRYVVELPPGYKPRKFDYNWVLSQWERAGCVVTYWVLPENAAKLAARKGGTVTNLVKGKYVGIKIPLAPKIMHRRRGNLDENIGTKDYK